MRRVILTQTGVGSSQICPMDYRAQVFQVGMGAELVSGTATFSVQHTFDDIYDPTVTPVWYPHATISAATANTDGNYAFPIAAIRLTITTGTGQVNLVIMQSSGQG